MLIWIHLSSRALAEMNEYRSSQNGRRLGLRRSSALTHPFATVSFKSVSSAQTVFQQLQSRILAVLLAKTFIAQTEVLRPDMPEAAFDQETSCCRLKRLLGRSLWFLKAFKATLAVISRVFAAAQTSNRKYC